jgi:hypothetical protein
MLGSGFRDARRGLRPQFEGRDAMYYLITLLIAAIVSLSHAEAASPQKSNPVVAAYVVTD